MDDDIGNFEEFRPFKHKNESYPACGVRSLLFLKRVLLAEMFPRDQEDDKIANFKQVCGRIIFQFFSKYAARIQYSKDPVDVTNLQFQIPSEVLSEIHDLAASASTDKCGKIMEYLSTSEIQQYRLEDGTTLKEEIGKDKMFNVSKHIGSAAMINRNSSAYRMSYQRLQNFQQTTHNVSSMIYQCVMFNLDAIHGIYHVPQSVFFSTDHILREERTELSKKCKGSPNNEAGRRLWQLGYKFEDKYYHRQLLLHGVAGFQVYWFSFNNISNGSLVDGTANSHSRVAQEDNKEAQMTVASEDTEGQSHVASTLDRNGSAASLNKRKDSSEILPTSRLKHIKLSEETEVGFNNVSSQESVNKE
ncbi:hypothetical protein BKA69DRAFT_1086530 [Paraphysoderma sedebokerense]|nr:hypothetical protein BKA69DRAFT_1086530 [Paraphysoderma sedebokerense]